MAEPSTQTVFTREAPEIEAYKLGLMKKAQELTAQPPSGGLPSVRVAPTSQLQQEVFNLAQQGLGSYQPYLASSQDAFASAIRSLGGGATTDPTAISQGIASYMNPYQQAVENAINRAYDEQTAKANLMAVGRPGGPSAFGGSRAAIVGQQIQRDRADALARAEAQNYLQARQGFENQQRRQLASGQALGEIGTRQAQLGGLGTRLQLAELQQLAGLGGLQRQIEQQQLEAQRQSGLQNIYEPYQRLGFYSDILRGTPSTQQTITTSSSPQPSLINQLVGTAAQGLGVYGAFRGLGGGGSGSLV